MTYVKMIEQIDKYWSKFFADPITVNTPDGPVVILPQRTNNILERFFQKNETSRTEKKRHGITEQDVESNSCGYTLSKES